MELNNTEYGSDSHLMQICAEKNLHAPAGGNLEEMLAFGRACIAAERERCAQICEKVQNYHEDASSSIDDADELVFREGEACGAEDCAEALRLGGDAWFHGVSALSRKSP